MAELAEDFAGSYVQGGEPPLVAAAARRLPSGLPRLSFPHRSAFHRTVRLFGLSTLIGSGLGLLAGISGLPINPFTMVGSLVLGLILIGISVRPSLRRPRF